MNAAFERTIPAMGTVISVMIAGGDHTERPQRATRALDWFDVVERHCSRFDASSELRQLCGKVDQPVVVSDLLFQAVQFAVAVAQASEGAFDPTLGALSEARGFDRHWRSGQRTRTPPARPPDHADAPIDRPREVAGWQHLELDAAQRTIRLHAPLLLDLGAVAKGMAIDLAARDLADLGNFAIDAGGDLFLSGVNASGAPWRVGIRQPHHDPDRIPDRIPDRAGACLAHLAVRDLAVCTSGDYERRSSDGVSTHLIDPATGGSSTRAVSATVVARSAMVADALATAVYVLGPARGLALLERQGVDGLLVTADGMQHMTPGMGQYVDRRNEHAA